MFSSSYIKRIPVNNIRFLFILSIILTASNMHSFAQLKNEGKIKCIVIDAGHGGKDTGAPGSKYFEKDIALSIALKVGNYIKTNMPDVKVIFTRDSDVFIPLQERPEIANKNQADVFISIHCNSNKSKTPYGAETYAMGLHKSADQLEVAKRENSVIQLEDDFTTKYEGFDNSPESYIMLSLMQNTYLDQSLTLASYVQDQFKERANRTVRGVKQAGFLVLWKTAMPSILVETGFISNPEEEKYLASSSGQDYLASAIYRAFKEYKNQVESKSIYALNHSSASKPKKDTISVLPETDSSQDKTYVTPVDTDNNFFAVQISASKVRVPLNSKKFKGLSNVEEYRAADIFKYTVGRKVSYNEILEYSKTIKNLFPDAFIVALKDGKIVPAKEVLNEIKN